VNISLVSLCRKVRPSRRLWSNGFNAVLNDSFSDVYTLFYYSFSPFMSFARDVAYERKARIMVLYAVPS